MVVSFSLENFIILHLKDQIAIQLRTKYLGEWPSLSKDKTLFLTHG